MTLVPPIYPFCSSETLHFKTNLFIFFFSPICIMHPPQMINDQPLTMLATLSLFWLAANKGWQAINQGNLLFLGPTVLPVLMCDE